MKTYVHRIVLARDVCHHSDTAFHRQMEAVVILRREAEDSKSSTNVALRLCLLRFAQQTRNCKFSTFGPQPRRFVDGFEGHQSTVGGAHEAVWIVEAVDGASGWLELAIKEFVERFYIVMS